MTAVQLDLFASQQLPPMSDDDAAWVRRTVWTEHHRFWNGGPQEWFRCRCQWSAVSGSCRRGDHRWCVSSRPLSGPDTYLTVMGQKRLHVAVWLADRVCTRGPCACRCGHRNKTTGHGPEIDAVFQRVRQAMS